VQRSVQFVVHLLDKVPVERKQSFPLTKLLAVVKLISSLNQLHYCVELTIHTQKSSLNLSKLLEKHDKLKLFFCRAKIILKLITVCLHTLLII